MAASLQSFLAGTPSRFYLETIEETKALILIYTGAPIIRACLGPAPPFARKSFSTSTGLLWYEIPMISEKEKKTILELSRKYCASKIVLFGSALSDDSDYRDIDIGVEGIADGRFFAFCGELILALPKPVDVVNLSQKSKFTDIILREGIALDA